MKMSRHCLWIVGNGTTLSNSSSVWKKLVIDAKDRGCFHNADEDKNLARALAAALLELKQIHDLSNITSILFREAKWKVCSSLQSIIYTYILYIYIFSNLGWRDSNTRP